MPEIAHVESKETAIDTMNFCVRIFEAMGFNLLINDIERAHRVPARNAKNGPKPIICRFVRQVTREEVVSREISSVDPKYTGLGDAADLPNSMLLDHLTPQVQKLLVEAKKNKIQHKYAFCMMGENFCRLSYGGKPRYQSERP